ncbi:hypothetical protein ATO12_14140 [Aquimarina atlantica]|uniref:Uncharacterized protein n=1 Tax=Aquimarina atlantica TaxID=1317122 RepID=A0A023BW35_9FLAO|nr:hypothetical protein ATO12_14140 [Aquimarina atlantica]
MSGFFIKTGLRFSCAKKLIFLDKKYLIFTFVKVKTLCIFARSFGKKFSERIELDISRRFIKIYSNEKNVSTIEEKEKKQTRFQRAYGFCKW